MAIAIACGRRVKEVKIGQIKPAEVGFTSAVSCSLGYGRSLQQIPRIDGVLKRWGLGFEVLESLRRPVVHLAILARMLWQGE